jgi:hypothetical protein
MKCNVSISSTFLGAAAQGERSVQMPFGLRQHVQQIRAYAAMVAAETHSNQAKELATLLYKTADDLEITARTVLTTLGSDPAHLSRPASNPLWPPGS